MKKRSVTKLLSCVLAISMAVTAAPMAAWASEVPAVVEEASEEVPDEVEEEKKEDAESVEKEAPQATGDVDSEDIPQIEGEGQDEAPEVLAPAEEEDSVPEVPEIMPMSIPIDGKNDAWAQDSQTVIGDDAVNEVYNNAYLHLMAGTGNGNSESNPAQYPAMFVNPKTFDFTEAGYFEFEQFQSSTNANTRYGVYLDYKSPGEGLFLGYNSSGWYWQKYGVEGNPYGAISAALPGQSVWTKIRIDWTADGKFSLTVGGNKVLDNMESGMQHGAEGKIAIKCGGWEGNVSNMYFNNIYYTGQDEVEGCHITGKVIDESGEPVSGVKLETGRQSAETAADGTYDLEVLEGNHTITVSKAGYVTDTISISAEGESIEAEDIVLYATTNFETMTLKTDAMDVKVAKDFPSIVQYEMKGSLAGKTFYGQVSRLMDIKVNGVSIKVNKNNVKAAFTDTKATYEMELKGENIDCIITAEISVEDNTASFDITKVENKLNDLDENGYAVYPVQTIEIPNHSLISVNSKQTSAHLKGAKISSNTRVSGDRDFDVTQGARLTGNATSEDFMYAFISNNEMSAGLWSNSEYNGTNVAAYVAPGGSNNTRVMATATDTDDMTTVGLASTMWYYDRKVESDIVVDRTTENGQNKNTVEKRTYVVGHEIMPSAKVVITGDENEDGDIDWQDGAVAFRSIMHNPYKSEEVPELVNYRIAMNFGSQAANPFLMNLDGVKRVYLNTEGLGQSVLLKGYGSEGHDSGHPDYGDIGKRIGGAEDMNTLLTEGKKMGAVFGVHVNASEMYTEAKAFSNELSQGNFGWNWLDQGIGINSRYDLATGQRENRFKELKKQVGDNLDFIYVDVWGNATSGWDNEDSWASRMLAREITGLGWRMTTEWGSTQEYDSTFQHWAADLAYGGYAAKGENSEVMRFLRNHQKDSWVADYPSYGGAAQAPLLGGLNMTDFEGWQGRTNYTNYITVMFRHNLITKYLQHYQVVDWTDGDPVQLTTGETWTPEMQIVLKNTKDKTDNTEVVVSRKSNDYSNLAEYRSRTIELNGVKISEGAPTGGDGSNAGNEKYLIPWNWDCNGNKLAADDLKLYHWNTEGGTSTWTLTKDWQGLSNVVIYKLTDEGKKDKKVVDVVNNTITLEDIEPEIPYVVFKGEKAPLTVNWQTSKYVYDTGFNDTDINSHRTVSGWGIAEIVDNACANNMLKLEDEISVSTTLTNLTKGQRYALYVGVDNRSDAKAHVTVKGVDGKVLGTNYTERSFAPNYVKSDQHHTNNGTVPGSNASYFQNLYVFFTAEDSTALLSFDREEGDGATYFDDIRIVETKMDAVRQTDKDGITTVLFNDFENNAQGIWPFVISSTEGVEDNRIHLSERNGKYTQAGYISKKVDDVLDGDWSVKVNGLSQRNNLIYQTIPQNFRFQPGETYYVSFDYQMGGDGVYEVRLGDGTNRNVESWEMSAAIGETKQFGFSFTAGESGQNWIGIFSTSQGSETGGYSGSLLDFSGYKDFILDNLRIEKARATIDKTYVEVSSAEEKIDLNVRFAEGVDPNTEVTWSSSDENVARVNGDGEVYFVGFGSSVITATAHFGNEAGLSRAGSEDIVLSCVVNLPAGSLKTPTFTGVWANTQETAGEPSGSGVASAVKDGSAATYWHSNWSGEGFTVSETNPAIITVQFEEDITEFESVSFQQRPSGSNGFVQKYECIVGEAFDSATNTITGEDGTDRFTTGVKNTANPEGGRIETLNLPEGTKGHYLQIRVLEGSNGYAALAEIWMQTEISFDTPEERAFMQANQDEIARQEEQVEPARNGVKEALEAAKAIYEGGEGNYSSASWEAFEAAYNAAFVGQNYTGLKKLEQLKQDLIKAQEGLEELTNADKEIDTYQDALRKAVEAAQAVINMGKGNYTEASWRAFETAYDTAKSGQSSTSVTTLGRLKTELEAAQAGLEETDNSGLEAEIRAARGELKKAVREAKAVLDEGKANYTAASWGAFEAAYDAANAGLSSASITTMVRLKAELTAALAGLEETTGSGTDTQISEAQAALKAAIETAKAKIDEGKGNYTAASWGAFEEAYDAAKAGEDSTSVTKLNRLKTELEAAQAGLKEATGTGIEEQITAAQNALKTATAAAKRVIDEGRKNYTEASWSAFEAAYDAAKAGETSAVISTLTRLKTELEAAQAGLEEGTNSGSDAQITAAQNALKTAIEAAKKIVDAGKKNYTEASWSAFENAYDAAVSGQSSTSVTMLNRLKTELGTAQSGLKENTGSGSDAQIKDAQEALKATTEAAKAIIDGGKKNYTSASWEAFEAAYDAAKAAESSISVTTLTRLKAALEAAQSGLKEAEEAGELEKKLEEAKKQLKAAIDGAKAVYEAGQKNYTNASWETFEAHYVRANNAYKVTASIAKMTRQAAALAKAQKALEENAKVGDTVTVNKVLYKVTSVTKKTAVAVRGTDKNAASISIASSVKLKGVSFKVISISAKAFKGYKKLRKVTIGSNVQTIKSEAFSGCTSLTQVSIGKKVTTIDKKAFYGCKKLKKAVFLGTAVKSVKSQAFKNTSASMKVSLPKVSSKKRASIKKMLINAGMNKKVTVR